MKKLYILVVTLLVTSLSFGQDLLISGVIDGPLPGGNPKGIELYVLNDIADLSVYGLESTTNGAAAAGVEWSFPADAAMAGSFIYVGNTGSTAGFQQYLGVTPNYENSVASINGDDTVILYLNGVIEDSVGEIGVDGTGTPWEYLDGWAYRIDGFGPNPTFDSNEWVFSGANALDGCDLADDTGTNAGCPSVFPVGTYTPTVNTNPSLTITSPNDGQVLPSGTTSVDITINVQNFVVGNPGAGIDGHIHWTLNGAMQPMKYNTDPETITVTDGDTYTVYMELVDNTHQPLVPAVNQTITFSVAYPCDLQIGTIVETCDNITPATTDTYNVTLDFTGGGTTTYTIDTGGIGTVGGDDPSAMAMGTITITNIVEGTDFTVTFTGDPMNSGCNFTRTINSPDCDPQLTLPLYEGFDYTVGSNLIDAPNWSNISSSTDEILIGGPGGLTYPNLASSSQTGNHVTFDGGGSDSAIQFTAVSTGTIYSSFLLNVSDLSAVTTPGYFALLGSFDARLWIVPLAPPSAQGGGGQYQIGISNVNTAPTGTALDPTVLSTGSTVLIVMSYDTDTGVMNAWVNPSDATFGSASAPSAGATETDASPQTNMNQFALRQDSTSETPFILFDELRIGTSWADVTPVTLSNNEFNLDALTIYPNPTNTGFVNIKSTNTDAMRVQVFDILGKQVKNETLTDSTLNVSNLNSGVYILKITQNNATTTKKLVIK